MLKDSLGTNTTTHLVNSLNQYTDRYCGSASPPEPWFEYAYDDDGNLITNGVFSYSYDAENRLIAAYSNSVCVVSNAYDYMSRRVVKVTPEAVHTFVYDGWNLVQELTHSQTHTLTNHYVWGKDVSGTMQGAGGVGGLLAVSMGGQYYFPCHDANGNITAYVDESGTVVAEYAYDAFGGTIAKSGSMADAFAHRFSTKYYDSETGLYYYGYRFYSLELHRWLNRDPIEEDGGLNLYAFCENNGINAVDVLGKSAYVFIYDSHDEMFQSWANSVKDKIEGNRTTSYGDKSLKFDPKTDTVHMVPIQGPHSFQQLRGIQDVVYLGSFGHGTGGRIWWGYDSEDGTQRSVVTGIPGYRPARPDMVNHIDMGALLLNFNTCFFVVEFYHCNTARFYDTDKKGRLLFPNAYATQPNTTGKDEGVASVISYYKSLLDKDQTGYPYSYRIYGSTGGLNNGFPGFRGYPRPVQGSDKKTEYP